MCTFIAINVFGRSVQSDVFEIFVRFSFDLMSGSRKECGWEGMEDEVDHREATKRAYDAVSC